MPTAPAVASNGCCGGTLVESVMRPQPLLLALLLALAATTPVHAGAARSPLPAPMLAITMPVHVDVSAYLASEKLDGVRARWDGRALWTRAGHRMPVPAWFTRGWPAVAMDGELWLGRGRFDAGSGLVRAGDFTDPAWRMLRFMAFDLPGDPSGFAQRSRRLAVLLERAPAPTLSRVRQLHFASRAALDAHLRTVVGAGGEGLMLHHALAPYRAGRSDTLLKLKLARDAEARVVGYRPGKGKYAGLVGALLVEDERGRRFALGSGLRDSDRAAPPPIGSRVTLRHDGLTAKGTPRFPRYLRPHAQP